MQKHTCFVVMPIGDQEHNGVPISRQALRDRYDDLIRVALLEANPDLDIIRADDIAAPGTVTSDILTRLMHSDYVLADVTYPNPNVFYELGLRHACRTKTIIIRERSTERAPFDIAHLRHIEYSYTPTGLKKLSRELGHVFTHFMLHPDTPDSHFLELAKLTNYSFPNFGKFAGSQNDALLTTICASPEVLNLFLRKFNGEKVTNRQIMQFLVDNPVAAHQLISSAVTTGLVSGDDLEDTSRKKPTKKSTFRPKRRVSRAKKSKS